MSTLTSEKLLMCLQKQLISIEAVASQYSVNDDLTGFASVLVPLQWVGGSWHIVLTLRASQLRHHGGEVAFPGGMWEPGDLFPIGTALRESVEEIALPSQAVTLAGGLKPLNTRRQTIVTPIVGVVDKHVGFSANAAEIDTIFSVPLTFFMGDNRLRTDIFASSVKATHWVPAYSYDGYEIWGFTAAVIVRLLNQCFGANITREHQALEKIW